MAALDCAVEHGARVAARPRARPGGPLRKRWACRARGRMPIVLPEAPAWTEMELPISRRKRSACSGAGIRSMRDIADLQEVGARTIGELQGTEEGVEPVAPEDLPTRRWPMARSGEDVAVGGIVSAVRPLKTRKGNPMAVAAIEDRHGSLEVVVFPETFKCVPPADRSRHARRHARQTRAGRRGRARARVGRAAHRLLCVSGSRARWRSRWRCRRTGGRRSRRWRICSRSTAATSPSPSSWS